MWCDVIKKLVSGLVVNFRNLFWPSFISLRFFSNSKILKVLKRSVGFYIGAFLPYFLENRIDEIIPVTVSVVLLGLCLIPFPMVKKSIWKQYFIRYFLIANFYLFTGIMGSHNSLCCFRPLLRIYRLCHPRTELFILTV